MNFCILASGSRGNSLFVESPHTRCLIDVGLSARQIELRLASREIDPETIDAIVLTHAHSDHVRGTGVFANRYKIPVWAHADTLQQVRRILKPGQRTCPWNEPFRIADLAFTPFRLSHDSDPTHGYLIETAGRQLVICTDLGVATAEVVEFIGQAGALLLESNHDPQMLMHGPYPWHLKERIASRHGHLSNHEAAALLKSGLNGRLQRVILGHLSQENNTPELALQTVLDHLGGQREDLIDVIEQRTVSKMYRIY